MFYFVYKDITYQIVVSYRLLKRKERKDFRKQKDGKPSRKDSQEKLSGKDTDFEGKQTWVSILALPRLYSFFPSSF